MTLRPEVSSVAEGARGPRVRVDGPTDCERTCQRLSECRLLTVKDFRAMFPVLGADAVYGLLRRGELPGWKLGNRWVFTPEALAGLLERITRGEQTTGDGSAPKAMG